MMCQRASKDDAEELSAVQENKTSCLPQRRLFSSTIQSLKNDLKKCALTSTSVTKVSVESAFDACNDRSHKPSTGVKHYFRKSESNNNCVEDSPRNVQSVSKTEQAVFKNADSLPFQHVDTDSIVGSKVVCPANVSLKKLDTSKLGEKHDLANSEPKKNNNHTSTPRYMKSSFEGKNCPRKSTSSQRRGQGQYQRMQDESCNTGQCRPLFVTSSNVDKSDGHQRKQSHRTAEQDLGKSVSMLDESHRNKQDFPTEQLRKKQTHSKDDCGKTAVAIPKKNEKQLNSEDNDVIKPSSKQQLCEKVVKHLPGREISSNAESPTRWSCDMNSGVNTLTGEQASSLSVSLDNQTSHNHSSKRKKTNSTNKQKKISQCTTSKLKVNSRSQCQDPQLHAAQTRTRECHTLDVQLPQKNAYAFNRLIKRTPISKCRQVQRSSIDSKICSQSEKNAMDIPSRLELNNCEPIGKVTPCSKIKDVSDFSRKQYAIRPSPEKLPSLVSNENWELNLLECFTFNEKSLAIPHVLKDINCVGVDLDSIKASSGSTLLSVSSDANTADCKPMLYKPPTPTDLDFAFKYEPSKENKLPTEELVVPVKYSYMEDYVDGEHVELELNLTEELVSYDNCILFDDQIETAVNGGTIINVSDNRVDLQCVDSGADVNANRNCAIMSPFKRLRADEVHRACMTSLSQQTHNAYSYQQLATGTEIQSSSKQPSRPTYQIEDTRSVIRSSLSDGSGSSQQTHNAYSYQQLATGTEDQSSSKQPSRPTYQIEDTCSNIRSSSSDGSGSSQQTHNAYSYQQLATETDIQSSSKQPSRPTYQIEDTRSVIRSSSSEGSGSSSASASLPKSSPQQVNLHHSNCLTSPRHEQQFSRQLFRVSSGMPPPPPPPPTTDNNIRHFDICRTTHPINSNSVLLTSSNLQSSMLLPNNEAMQYVKVSPRSSFVYPPPLPPPPPPPLPLFSFDGNSTVLPSTANGSCIINESPISSPVTPIRTALPPNCIPVFHQSPSHRSIAGKSCERTSYYSFSKMMSGYSSENVSEASAVDGRKQCDPAFVNTFQEICPLTGSSSNMIDYLKDGVDVVSKHSSLEGVVSNEYEQIMTVDQTTPNSLSAWFENAVWPSVNSGQTSQSGSLMDNLSSDSFEVTSEASNSYNDSANNSLLNSSGTLASSHPMPNRKNRRLPMNRNGPVAPAPGSRATQLVQFQVPKKRLSYDNNNYKKTASQTISQRTGNSIAKGIQSDEVPDSWEDIEDLKVPYDCCSEKSRASSGDEGENADWFNPSVSLFEKSKNDSSGGLWKHKLKPTYSEWMPIDTSKDGTSIKRSSPAAQGSDDSSLRCRSDSVSWKQAFANRYSTITVPFIDSHCHIDFIYKRTGFAGSFEKFRSTQSELFPSSFAGCVAVFCKPDTWIYESKGCLFNSVLEDSKVWGAVGCHPKHAVSFTGGAEVKLRAMLKHKKVVALGEIGLDYSGSFYQHHECQKEVLRRQVKIALELNLPLVIHSRDSEQDTIDELEKLVPRNYRIHRHCFTGSWAEAEIWLQKFPGSYIGVTPLVTYNGHKSASVRDMVKNIPLDKLLLETDAPYFPPKQVPSNALYHSGSHPGFAITVAETVAELRCISMSEVLEACYRNTKHMYGI